MARVLVIVIVLVIFTFAEIVLDGTTGGAASPPEAQVSQASR